MNKSIVDTTDIDLTIVYTDDKPALDALIKRTNLKPNEWETILSTYHTKSKPSIVIKDRRLGTLAVACYMPPITKDSESALNKSGEWYVQQFIERYGEEKARSLNFQVLSILGAYYLHNSFSLMAMIPLCHPDVICICADVTRDPGSTHISGYFYVIKDRPTKTDLN